MTIVLMGASSSGKDLIQNTLVKKYGYNKILKYTTRNPRYGEKNGKDYWFVSRKTFNEMIIENEFAEYEEFSQDRYYGTIKKDYISGENITILTPCGLRNIRKLLPDNNIFSVYIKANLGTRMKRYINRIGTEKFTFDDKNEMAARVERDFGMFLGIEEEADLIIENNEGTNFNDLVSGIVKCVEERKQKKRIL